MLDTTCGRVALVWADSGHTDTLPDRARATLGLVAEIVKRPDLPTFTVLPGRRVVERTLSLSRQWSVTPCDSARVPQP